MSTTTVLGMNNQTNQRRGEYLVENSETGRYDINNCSVVFNISDINSYASVRMRTRRANQKKFE
jgi:hypothetical protein